MPRYKTARIDYKPDGRRCESDVTDQEWAIIESILSKQGRLGRPREMDLREVLKALQGVLATACQWRALPKVLPPYSPYSMVGNYFKP